MGFFNEAIKPRAMLITRFFTPLAHSYDENLDFRVRLPALSGPGAGHPRADLEPRAGGDDAQRGARQEWGWSRWTEAT